MKGLQSQFKAAAGAPHSCPITRRSFLQGRNGAFTSGRPGQSRSHFHFAVVAVGRAKAPQPPPVPADVRLRLNNLAPQPGSRDKETRKGRGYGAGQGGSCGFGMRGQNSRSGPGTRPGFEGGQMPLYRRVPKLRGIAGGMSAGVPKHVVVNLHQLASFKESEEVSLDVLKEKRILNVSGKEARLPLKVLGDGDLNLPLTIKAEVFSSSAKKKIKKAGGTMVETPKKIKWTRAIGRQRLRAKASAEADNKVVKEAKKPAKKAAEEA